MVGKNGYDCLLELKDSRKLDKMPIVMYFTAHEEFVADVLYDMGATVYINKPSSFDDMKIVLQKALCFVTYNLHNQPSRENFLISVYND